MKNQTPKLQPAVTLEELAKTEKRIKETPSKAMPNRNEIRKMPDQYLSGTP